MGDVMLRIPRSTYVAKNRALPWYAGNDARKHVMGELGVCLIMVYKNESTGDTGMPVGRAALLVRGKETAIWECEKREEET